MTQQPGSAADPSAAGKTVLTNVRVFDGQQLTGPRTVVIDGVVIGADPAGGRVTDGGGAVVLPGLIDAHVHLSGRKSLQQLAGYGVTTALDMGTWPVSLVDSLRSVKGLTDIRSAGTSAVAPGSLHSRIPGFPAGGQVTGPDDAGRYVAERVAEGSDYIKVIVEDPGFDRPTIDALAAAARRHGKLSVAHAASFAAIAMALEAQVDVITHSPLDKVLDDAAVARFAAAGRISVPTLTMMEGTVEQSHRPGDQYAPARATVTALYRAGVPILAGTDANDAKGVPANIPHGESLHHELELLVDAGLPAVDALRAATSLPARYFGLPDRGVIEPGRRADLLLIDGDPVADITATRQIQRIWLAGTERSPA